MRTERLMSKAFAERGRPHVILWESLAVRDGEKLRIRFESANSRNRQGLWLATDRGIVVAGRTCPSVYLWRDTAPDPVDIVCNTTNGGLSFYNVWEGAHGVRSQAWSSGMLAEPDGALLRYRCNDVGFETCFDRLVFTIQRLS